MKSRPDWVSAKRKMTQEPSERLEEASPGRPGPGRSLCGPGARGPFHGQMEHGSHRRPCGSNASATSLNEESTGPVTGRGCSEAGTGLHFGGAGVVTSMCEGCCLP